MKKLKLKYSKQLTSLLLLLSFAFIFSGCRHLIVLDSKGTIGQEEVNLIWIAFILMLIVVIPVFVLTFWFTLKYKSENKQKYTPNWAGSAKIEWLIWMVPIAIVAVLSYLTWVKTHQLDPYKSLKVQNKEVRVEVISMDWKWLFIYPDYNIATTNQLVFPEHTPLNFQLTSASVMTSFFIPQLGSQMYAMAGMKTQLNLMAVDTGSFTGQNQEFSGEGYETMFFDAKSVTESEFKSWLKKVSKEGQPLDSVTFYSMIEPTVNDSIRYFKEVTPGLFEDLIKKFMAGKIKPVQKPIAGNDSDEIK